MLWEHIVRGLCLHQIHYICLFVAMFPVVDLSAGYEATSSVENSEI
jgi:hypothetical protein